MPESQDLGNIRDDWDAQSYLKDYYSVDSVADDEAFMYKFIADGLRTIGRVFPAGIEVGCGPVLHHAAQTVPWLQRLDMADFQEANLAELRKWLSQDPGAHDWSVFLNAKNGVLEAEGSHRTTLDKREALLRERVKLMPCDLRNPQPLGRPATYPFVSAFYCLEWVEPTLAGWQQTMRYVMSMVEPGGWFLVVGVCDTTYCNIGGRPFPSAAVSTDDVRKSLLEFGMDPSSVKVAHTPGLAPEVSGIKGTFMAFAQRPAR
ncbi:MAG: hypothetical protein H6Q90_3339 [Deltaproteobacteria bacterium]|nr:hypothetical protein [Deltaproteobacteria bacterium]